MKIMVISDTHGDHAALGTMSGDVLIHCGDFCLGGRHASQVLDDLDAWFGRQAFRYILCTGGNHDDLVEERRLRGQRVFRHATCLEDEGMEIDGFRFYGAPWVPELTEWAHYLTADELDRAWRRIPADVDVLITHTPPRGVLDTNSRGKACGCPSLTRRLAEVRPQVHCFGHVHASAGTQLLDGTLYINASVVNSRYRVVRLPVSVELQRPRMRT